MGRKSRTKGSSFEREIAKAVVAAFAEFGVTDKDCYRTPMSGGHRYASQNDPGDLIVSEKLVKLGFPYTVECKRDERFELWHLFLPADLRERKPSWVEDSFILQSCASASGGFNRRIPVVVARRNNGPAFVLFPSEALPVTMDAVLGTRLMAPGVVLFNGPEGQRYKTWVATLFDVWLADHKVAAYVAARDKLSVPVKPKGRK